MAKRTTLSSKFDTLHLINLAERARSLGQTIEADYLLLRAWTAYDSDSMRAPHPEPDRGDPATL